jgi:hypothetical protein
MNTALVPLDALESLALQEGGPRALFLKEARAAERFFDFLTSNI